MGCADKPQEFETEGLGPRNDVLATCKAFTLVSGVFLSGRPFWQLACFQVFSKVKKNGDVCKNYVSVGFFCWCYYRGVKLRKPS